VPDLAQLFGAAAGRQGPGPGVHAADAQAERPAVLQPLVQAHDPHRLRRIAALQIEGAPQRGGAGITEGEPHLQPGAVDAGCGAVL
jgi:hypothetical protein